MKKKIIHYRRTKESDLLAAMQVIARSFDDLRKRNGMKPFKRKITEPDPVMVHLQKSDPESTFVATDAKGKIIGYTQSQVRENEWYLAFLFVEPAYQSEGVGGKLLTRAMKCGTENQCQRRALCTFAYNPQAVALYSKHGMTPQRAILVMTRKNDLKKNQRRTVSKSNLKFEVTKNVRLINKFSRLDRKARGVARPEEHFLWMDSNDAIVLAFHADKKLVGYSVIFKRGFIGPVAATNSTYLRQILEMSIDFGIRQRHEDQFLFAFGENSEIVSYLLNQGFRIAETDLLMATEMVGNPALYVPAHLALY
jgi:ribosomal protein S18 acetylase RimI-like enzyme